MNYLRVRKSELPMPLIVEGDNGETVVQMIEPAGKNRIGARLGAAGREVVQWFRETFKGRK